MTETKVVAFPKAKRQRGPKTDAELTEEIRRARRKLVRAIEAARRAGLTVESGYDFHVRHDPVVTRRL